MTMLNLPDEVLRHIFEHLGRGHYRFIGGTCKKWENVYREQVNRKVIIEPKKPPAKKHKPVSIEDDIDDDILTSMIMFETRMLERGRPRSRELLRSEAARGGGRAGVGANAAPAAVDNINADQGANNANHGTVAPMNGPAGMLRRMIFGRRGTADGAGVNAINNNTATGSNEAPPAAASAAMADMATGNEDAVASSQGSMLSNNQAGAGTENDSTTSHRIASFPSVENAQAQGGLGGEGGDVPSLARAQGGTASYPPVARGGGGGAAAVNNNAADIPLPPVPDDVPGMLARTGETAAAVAVSAAAAERLSAVDRLAFIERRAAARFPPDFVERASEEDPSFLEGGGDNDSAAIRRRRRILTMFRRDPLLAMAYSRRARLAVAAEQRPQQGQQQGRGDGEGGQNNNNNSNNNAGVVRNAARLAAAGRIADEDIIRALEGDDDDALSLFHLLRRSRKINARKQKAKHEQQPPPKPPPTYLRTGETQTSMRSISESVSKCRLFLAEIPENGPWSRINFNLREENIVNNMFKVMVYAANEGNIEVLKFAEIAVDEARKSYRIKALEEKAKQEKERTEELKRPNVANKPVAKGTKGVLWDLDYLDKRRPDITFEVGMNASKKGWVEVLDWMHRMNDIRSKTCSPPWNEITCYRAARFGQLKSVQWLHSHGCRWDSWTCAYAARFGHYELLVWAHSKGCPWDVKTTAWGAMNGNIDCLKFARANKCPWNEETCTNLGKIGRLEALKWARSQGCPWHIDQVIIRSKRNGHQHVVDWVEEQQRLQEEQRQQQQKN